MRLLAILILLSACSAPFRTTVTITGPQLQAKLAERFPIEKNALVASIELTNPRVSFEQGGDRIGIEFDAIATVLDEHHAGTVGILGGLRYESGVFYLTDPELTRFEVPDLGPEKQAPIRAATNLVLAGVLPEIPVHELDKPSDQTARALIRSVSVQDQKVLVELGL